MKYNKAVTANRKKNRKAVFTAPSHQRRILMSAPLSKELRLKYKVKSVPIRKDDEVKIVRGDFSKTQNEGKVTCVYRKRNIIQVNGVSRDRNSGMNVPVGIKACNVVITKLYMDPGRKQLLERKSRDSAANKNKGKISEAEVAGANLD